MTKDEDFQQIEILIPGYSIEDLPTDLPEKGAASLLNAFSTAWHPRLLQAASSLPCFRQAESTDLPTGQHIVFIPECSEEWLGHEWQDHFQDTLSVVVHECFERQDYQDLIEAKFPGPEVDAELLHHFFALGTTYLQVMLLSRRMHHYVDPDMFLLETEATAAAKAALAGDAPTAKDHLRRCFECLLDCREQFYPVECFLVDVCLPSDQTTTEDLTRLVNSTSPLSLVCSGGELDRFMQDGSFAAAVANRAEDKGLCLLTGHQHELRTSLSSLATLYSDLRPASHWEQSGVSNTDVAWARRRFGMTSSLPNILNQFRYSAALHVVLDDGIYPDREYGQLTWQAPDGAVVPSVSRIPLAIDGASSFLRFADRYTESMQEDTNAVVLVARLSEVKTPWLQDLRVCAEYAPVIGEFVTLAEFARRSGGQSSPTRFGEGEYLSPYLIQSSVLKTEAPISSPEELFQARSRIESLAFLQTMDAILKPSAFKDNGLDDLLEKLNAEESARIDLQQEPNPEAADDRLAEIQSRIQELSIAVLEELVQHAPGTTGEEKSTVILNGLPWKRRVSFVWPDGTNLPMRPEFESEFWRQGPRVMCSVEIPAGGFLWFRSEGGGHRVAPTTGKGKPLAERLLLRNRHYEVNLSEATGGIAEVRFHNQRANRVSQVTAFRYEESQTFHIDDEEVTSAYATTRMVSSKVLESGPFEGVVETSCEIVDVGSDEVMARFRQTFTVERDSKILKIRIDVDSLSVPLTGNPWMTYLACRFAWDNESAAITRSMLGQASGFRMERFEAPDYVEIADSDQRVLIMPQGRPYHRRSGPRMLDSLLLVEGETRRSFSFCLDFDQPFPMRSVLEVSRPPVIVSPSHRTPGAAESGWILGVSSRNVQLARTRVVRFDDSEATLAIRMLLQETEGRSTRCRILCIRTPRTARIVFADGSLKQDLNCSANGTELEFDAFQVKEVELTF